MVITVRDAGAGIPAELLNSVFDRFVQEPQTIGGWDLPAAEAVCCGENVDDWEVFDLLTALADKSLIVYDSDGQESRFRLLAGADVRREIDAAHSAFCQRGDHVVLARGVDVEP